MRDELSLTVGGWGAGHQRAKWSTVYYAQPRTRTLPIARGPETSQNPVSSRSHMGPDSPEPANSPSSTGDRLDSWKEIAAHLNRHVTTVRWWEKSEGLPVHRHIHDKLGSVYAFRAELDAWWRNRRVQLEQGVRESGTSDRRTSRRSSTCTGTRSRNSASCWRTDPRSGTRPKCARRSAARGDHP